MENHLNQIKRFLRFTIIWVACNLSIPFWVVGHVHLTLNIYQDLAMVLSSLGMNIIVALGFWLNWKDESKQNYNMKPIGKYIAIKNIDEQIKTESGIILSGDDVNQMRYKRGLIIETGTDVNPAIKKDDQIYYDKAQGFTMLIEDKQFTIISERDVVVVL